MKRNTRIFALLAILVLVISSIVAVTASSSFAASSLEGAKIAKISNQAYTGKAIRPAVTVTLGSNTLRSSDYTVAYSKNTEIGTATVTITGRGQYRGSQRATFRIVPARVEGLKVSAVTETSFNLRWFIFCKRLKYSNVYEAFATLFSFSSNVQYPLILSIWSPLYKLGDLLFPAPGPSSKDL